LKPSLGRVFYRAGVSLSSLKFNLVGVEEMVVGEQFERLSIASQLLVADGSMLHIKERDTYLKHLLLK
jgi:predicted metallopeptidase